MGYRIQYGVSRVDKLSANPHGRLQIVIAVAVIVGILVVSAFWPERLEAFRRELLPIFTESGSSALMAFFDNIDSGAGFSDAIEVFCGEIIHAAQN